MRPVFLLLFLGIFPLCLGCNLHQGVLGEPPARESPTLVVMGRAGDTLSRPALTRSGARDAVLAHDAGQLPEQMGMGNAPCLSSGAVASQGEAASVQIESVHLLEAPSSVYAAGQPREAMCY